MPLSPAARPGLPLIVKQRELEFSYFPMTRTNRRWGLHSMLYAANPWAVIDGAINDALLPPIENESAHSFVRQAQEYFRAAEEATAIETKPLLFYYSFLNVGKAISLARGRPGIIGKLGHGISAQHLSGYKPSTSEVRVYKSGGDLSALDELHQAIEGRSLTTSNVPISELLAQSVIGHRMWRTANAPPIRKERFFAVDRVRWFHDASTKEIWLRLYVRSDSLTSRNRGLTETLTESRLSPAFRLVDDVVAASEGYRTFEQVTGTVYTALPSDVVMDSVETVRPYLWQTVTAAPPYRRFYIYLSPQKEARVPQWMSAYATLFWLGSLTRYQPVELLENLRGPFGPFFQEFIQTQPGQLLYLLASEVQQQDVSKPGVV